MLLIVRDSNKIVKTSFKSTELLVSPRPKFAKRMVEGEGRR